MSTTESVGERDRTEGAGDPGEDVDSDGHDGSTDHLEGRGQHRPPTGDGSVRRGTADGTADTASASLRARTNEGSRETGWLWKVLASLGALSLLGAIGVAVAPAVFDQSVQFTSETVRSLRSFALLLGAFVGIFGLYVAYHRETDQTGSRERMGAVELPAANPERSHGPLNDVAGSRLDQRLERIDGAAAGATGDQYSVYQVEQTLTALAVRVVADAADCSEARARKRVERGTWTDDVRAAAFLGGPDAPGRPLSMRIEDWARGSTFDRQVRATVDELAELAGGETA